MLLSLLILQPLLSGCAKENSSPAVTPELVEYSPAFQTQAADELAAMKEPCARDVANEHCSATHRLAIDYLDMRDQTRAIIN